MQHPKKAHQPHRLYLLLLLWLSFQLSPAGSTLINFDQFMNSQRQRIISQVSDAVTSGTDVTLNLRDRFKMWTEKFMKHYGKEEEAVRFHNFQQNWKIVQQHNAIGSDYEMDINKFGDLTDDEFVQTYQMVPDPNMKKAMTAPMPPQQLQNPRRLLITTSVNWRQFIDFNPIKDQGGCAACYAFADIGAIQLQWAFRKNTRPPSLSEQQIIDCCPGSGYQCNGCVSGSMGSTIDYLAQAGIATTSSYPYTFGKRPCKNRFSKKYYLNQGGDSYYQINGVRATIYYLVRHGPLSVAIDSTKWKLYKKGVFNDCPPKPRYSHAVVLIGVSPEGIWDIRNSWGRTWGDQGYIKLAKGNSCGLTDYVFLPIVI